VVVVGLDGVAETIREGDHNDLQQSLRAVCRFLPGVCDVPGAHGAHIGTHENRRVVSSPAAEKQYERELLFSTLVDLVSQVVTRSSKSVHAAYTNAKRRITVSVQALYDKLDHVEPCTSRSLVQHTAEEASRLIDATDGCCEPLVRGYRLRILDGNLRGSEKGSSRAKSQSKNSPLITAFGPAVLVTLITTLPLIAHWRYSPPEYDETVSVSSTAPVAELVIWIVSLRPF
jgi:hypothetical protein